MWRLFYLVTRILIGLMLISILCYAFSPKPDLTHFTSYSTAYLDRQQQLLRLTLANDDRYRLYTPLNHIADSLQETTVLYEDKHFYQHMGIDIVALARAFWTTYVLQQRRIGASTITMQLARLRWNIPSYSLLGKMEQIIRAIQLTRHYSKKDILEAYLNLAPYGRNIEGIGAASLIYFNKLPAELSLPEALTLAVIPQNPNKRTPTNFQGMNRLSTARQSLFLKWVEQHPEDQFQQSYLSLPLLVRSPENLPFYAPHFIDYLNLNSSPWQSGYIHTHLDLDKQRNSERILSRYVEKRSREGIHNAAALVVNYKTMDIEAMVGSVDFFNTDISGQVNGTIAKRSPGSTLKPFVYGLAMDAGLIHPMTLMKDAPTRFGGFTPENYDQQFLGPLLASEALIQSRNVPAVDLQAKLPENAFYQMLKKADVSGLKSPDHYGLALALGGGELTMLELVTLYSMLANQGQLKQPRVLNTHNDNDNKPNKLLSAEASFITLSILKDNPAPNALTISSHQSNQNEVAWKTGTSWAYRDAWAVGISGDYVIAVWVGNFDGKGNDSFIGRTAAGPLLFSLFNAIVPQHGWTVEQAFFSNKLNIRQIEMCQTTGDLPSQYCPNTAKTWFIPGVSPIKVSTVYRSIPILKSNGKRACWSDPLTTEPKTFAFWPSDLLHIFKQAGISLKQPPAFDEHCNLTNISSTGLAPSIRSPQTTLNYIIDNTLGGATTIPFSATVDSDVNQVFWFVNDRYVGQSKPDKSFFWQAQSGQFRVRVVDDIGRSSSISIKVISQH